MIFKFETPHGGQENLAFVIWMAMPSSFIVNLLFPKKCAPQGLRKIDAQVQVLNKSILFNFSNDHQASIHKIPVHRGGLTTVVWHN